LYKPKHPFADSNGCIYEHRFVMEQHLGRYLKRQEQIHHKNENKQDNRIDNLQLVTQREHLMIHKRPISDKSDRFCQLCRNKTNVNKNGVEYWTKAEGGWICAKCREKRIYRINRPLIGRCQTCGKKVGDTYSCWYKKTKKITRTNYSVKYGMELCSPCLCKLSWKIKHVL